MKKVYLLFLILLVPFISAFNFGQSTSTTINSTSIFLNGSEVLHNDLSDLQGGAAGQYYHLPLAWYNELFSDISDWITKAEADTYYSPINEPIWSSNYSAYNNSWSNMTNMTYDTAYQYVTNGTFGSVVEPLWNANYSDFLTAYNYALNETLWSNNYSLYNDSWSNITNMTYNTAYQFIINGSLSTTETLWNSNYTNFLTAYNYATNSSFLLNSDWNSNYSINDPLWRTVTNTSYYLATNPFGFYNSTNLPASSETLWNANYSTFLTHIDWPKAMNGTLLATSTWNSNYSTNHPAWLNTTNFSYVPYTGANSNVNLGGFDLTAHNIYAGYLGGTAGSLNMATDVWELTGNLSPATTLVSSLGSGSNRWAWLWVQNISSEWIDNAYGILTNNLNASGNITATGYFLGNGSQLTDIDISETDPFWRGNYSAFNDSWNNMTNFSYGLATEPIWSSNYSAYNSSWSSITNSTYNTAYLFTTNSTFLPVATWNSNYSSELSSWLNTTNMTYNNYNSTGLIINWSLASAMEVDPYWTANYTNYNNSWSSITNTSYGLATEPIWSSNYSAYNSSWSSITNATYKTAYDYVTNGTFQSNTTSYQYVVNGSIPDWIKINNGTILLTSTWNSNYSTNDPAWRTVTNTSYYLATNPFGFYNSTTLPASPETLWNANYSTFLTHRPWSDSLNGTLMSQATFNSNYSTNDAAYRNTTNMTYNTWAYNQTSPAITTILGYNYYNSTNLPTSPETLWNANYSTFLTHIDWAKAMNGTLLSQATYNTNYSSERPYWNTAYQYVTNGTFGSGTEPLWNANYSVFLLKLDWAKAMNGTLLSTATWNSNYSTQDAIWKNTTNTSYGLATEPIWSSNYSAYNSSWSSITNTSYLGKAGGTMIGNLNMSSSSNISISSGSILCLEQTCAHYIRYNGTATIWI